MRGGSSACRDPLGFPRKELGHALRGRGSIRLLRDGAERRQVAIDEAGIELRLAEILGPAQRRKESEIGAGSGNERAIERRGQSFERLPPGRPAGDYFRDQRIIKRRDLRPLLDPGVDPNAVARRELQGNDPPRRWQKPPFRVLGVDAGFDGVARHGDIERG